MIPDKRWDGAQPRQRPCAGCSPAPQHPAASPALWLGALGFSSSGKKKEKKNRETRHGSCLFPQAAAAEYSLTYFFSSPPFILTYFGAAAAAAFRTRGALPSAPHCRLQELSQRPALGIRLRQKHRPPFLVHSGGRAPQKASDPLPWTTQSCRNLNPRPPHGGITP